MKCLMVVPVYYPAHLSNVRVVAAQAENHGFEVVAYCNSSASAAKAREIGLNAAASRQNVGYGRAVNLSAAGKSFDWLIVCNDDLRFESAHFAEFVEVLSAVASSEPWTIGAVHRPAWPEVYPMPGVIGVFGHISLLRAVKRRFSGQRSFTPNPVDAREGILHEVRANTAFPFVCAAISSACWKDLAGFDPDFDLYFEDTDFLARGSRIDGHRFGVVPVRFSHDGSGSSRKNLRLTIPVLAWSAYLYLVRHTGLGPVRARCLLLIALALRLLFAPLTRGPRREHFAGTARALRTIVTGRRPELPPWNL